VLITPARPATSLALFLFLPGFLASKAPVVTGLVFSDLLDVFLGPKPHLESVERLNRRSFDLFLYDPAVESAPANPEHPCHFDRRICLHRYNEIGLFHLSRAI
jgi:hypothetical protein